MEYNSTCGLEGFQKLSLLRIRSGGLSDKKECGMAESKAGLGYMTTDVACSSNY
jgi:hypothetical protein